MAQLGTVGVGDVIQYAAAPLVYIGSVISPTQFRVQLAAGGAPANTGAVAVTSIRRAFNSISNAVSQSSTASYLGTGNLVTAEPQAHLGLLQRRAAQRLVQHEHLRLHHRRRRASSR